MQSRGHVHHKNDSLDLRALRSSVANSLTFISMGSASTWKEHNLPSFDLSFTSVGLVRHGYEMELVRVNEEEKRPS